MRKLKFPSYKYIKSLPRGEEYDWILFETPASAYGEISYNEDSSGWIYFDVVEYGYVETNNLGMALKFNKTNYEKICEHAQEVFNDYYDYLEKDCTYMWDKKARENVEDEK